MNPGNALKRTLTYGREQLRDVIAPAVVAIAAFGVLASTSMAADVDLEQLANTAQQAHQYTQTFVPPPAP